MKIVQHQMVQFWNSAKLKIVQHQIVLFWNVSRSNSKHNMTQCNSVASNMAKMKFATLKSGASLIKRERFSQVNIIVVVITYTFITSQQSAHCCTTNFRLWCKSKKCYT